MHGDGLERELGFEATFFGTAEVGHNNDGRTIVYKLFYGGERFHHTGIVGDVLVVVDRNIEVDTQEDLTAFEADIFD